MERTDKKAYIGLICFLGSFFVIAFGVGILTSTPKMQLKSSPEQAEQVEVVEKRINKTYIGSSRGIGESKTAYTFYISFKFSDGSVKEFEVGRDSIGRGIIREPYNKVYDSLNEGDTGILTYKELKNAENRYYTPSSYRLFISFEKD